MNTYLNSRKFPKRRKRLPRTLSGCTPLANKYTHRLQAQRYSVPVLIGPRLPKKPTGYATSREREDWTFHALTLFEPFRGKNKWVLGSCWEFYTFQHQIGALE
jgi:hypothetical protein